MKFTIVITTYNRLSLLKRAIDSALNQTEKCQVIVVDDCSCDGTADYLESLGEQIIFYRTQENLGHSVAMNIGVENAQSDWIKPLDDDDYLAPNCIEKMIQVINSHPSAVICSCQAVQVKLNGQKINRTPLIGKGQAFYIPQADIHYGMLLEQVPFGTTSQVAFRQDIFVKSGGWNPSLNVCDEIDSWIRMAQFGDAIFINESLVYRTVWQGGYNHSHSLLHRRELNILMKDKIYSLVNKKYESVIPSRQAIRNYVKLHWFLVALKQKQIFLALIMAFPAVLSLVAWKLLFDAMKARASRLAFLNILGFCGKM